VSYHIYTTQGLILSERPLREADRVYSILTKDLGLLRATALGVRKEGSKLRGSLEPVSLVTISLVRGKEYWRVTSADSLKKISPKKEVLRPLALLERMVPGESHHKELFEVVEKLVTSEAHDEDSETKLVAEILFHLGYLKESDLNLPKKELIKVINEGLQASHLN
jgi:recombinational DNA repair protein (RecF pathway)